MFDMVIPCLWLWEFVGRHEAALVSSQWILLPQYRTGKMHIYTFYFYLRQFVIHFHCLLSTNKLLWPISSEVTWHTFLFYFIIYVPGEFKKKLLLKNIYYPPHAWKKMSRSCVVFPLFSFSSNSHHLFYPF